jgi:hypothetical protein
MKSYQRLLIFVLLVLFLTALLSPWAATAWDLMSGAESVAREDRIPFSRIFNRLFMISGVLLFFAYRPLLKSHRRLSWASRRGHGPGRYTSIPLALGSMPCWAIMSLASLQPFFRSLMNVAQCVQAYSLGSPSGFRRDFSRHHFRLLEIGSR